MSPRSHLLKAVLALALLLAACSQPPPTVPPTLTPISLPTLAATASPTPDPNATPLPARAPFGVTENKLPYETQTGDTLLTIAAHQSGERAFGMAGVSRSDIDVCDIYDSFTITVLATLENLGFCKPGEGGDFVSGGRIKLGGELPVNPDGGGLSNNHPGMRGIFLVIEATRQLRGEGDARQVAGAELACVHGTGGTLGVAHSGATLILGAG